MIAENIYTFSFSPENKNFKHKMLNWANQFNIFCFLDSCDYKQDTYTSFSWQLAANALRTCVLGHEDSLQVLQNFVNEKSSWLFGHLSFHDPLINNSTGKRDDPIVNFEKGFFFEPGIRIICQQNQVTIHAVGRKAEDIYYAILNSSEFDRDEGEIHTFINMPSKEKYVSQLAAIKEHIQRGDCYEMNYCTNFSAGTIALNPVEVFLRLIQASPTPFAALYKKNEQYCICASPERYIKKSGKKIISQPIKGTVRNIADQKNHDQSAKEFFQENEKERSENVMIVDLVRNDLSRICLPGTVQVEDLFGVYAFSALHHMISTVTGVLKDDTSLVDIFTATFPMGSMTGAPKKRVMELTAKYESFERGLYSGTIGYISPYKDFDFNVVIRSIFYDKQIGALSFAAGGGITAGSDIDKEWEECLLKVKNIVDVLSN